MKDQKICNLYQICEDCGKTVYAVNLQQQCFDCSGDHEKWRHYIVKLLFRKAKADRSRRRK